MADIEASANLCQPLPPPAARRPPRQCLTPLMGGQLLLPAEPHALCMGPLPPFARAFINSRSNAASPPRTVSINLPWRSLSRAANAADISIQLNRGQGVYPSWQGSC
jgi:hypothetical protein